MIQTEEQGYKVHVPELRENLVLIPHSWKRKALQPCRPDAPETGQLEFAGRELMQCNLGIPKAQ
jgi:hypothetical protein